MAASLPGYGVPTAVNRLPSAKITINLELFRFFTIFFPEKCIFRNKSTARGRFRTERRSPSYNQFIVIIPVAGDFHDIRTGLKR